MTIQHGAEVSSKILDLITSGKTEEAKGIVRGLTRDQRAECREGMIEECGVSRRDAGKIIAYLAQEAR